MDTYLQPTYNTNIPSFKEYEEPLPEGTIDLTGDRGVLVNIKERASQGQSPSQKLRFVELELDGFLTATGECFESTHEEGRSKIMDLNKVFDGLRTALFELRTGDVATIIIDPVYAYGEKGFGNKIPPDAELRFEVKVLDVRETELGDDSEEVRRSNILLLQCQQGWSNEPTDGDRFDPFYDETGGKADRAAQFEHKKMRKRSMGGKRGGKAGRSSGATKGRNRNKSYKH